MQGRGLLLVLCHMSWVAPVVIVVVVVVLVVWVNRATWLLFFSYCGLVVVIVDVVVTDYGGGCNYGWLLKFVVDVFIIIILISYLYYFNQIAKNIDPLILNIL